MKVLLIEDDRDLGHAVQAHLEAAGHTVSWCTSLATASQAPTPEMLLLDLSLPDGDGLVWMQSWRESNGLPPTMVLTARDQVSDRIRGLQAGADDYLVKPFDLDELLARLDAVARRTRAAAPPARRWSVDLALRQLHVNGEPQELTRMEWAVLACLAGRVGRLYSRSEIEEHLRDAGLSDAQSNSLEVVVSRLRKKLGPGAISTHRGLGYRLE